MPLPTASLSSRFMSFPFVSTTVLCRSNTLRLKEHNNYSNTVYTQLLLIRHYEWLQINRQIIHDFSFLLQVGFNACSFKRVNSHGLVNVMSVLELECFTSSESV